MADPLRHHRAHRGQQSRAERSAERFADFLGTTRFIVISSTLILAWIAVNAVSILWDPYPFILLNLAFSAFAFYTGALVIIAQKAQTTRDRAREEADANHREELHGQIVELIAADTDLTRQVHALINRRPNVEVDIRDTTEGGW